eukprot:SAG22_NODE_1020_length_5999_cov_8.921186_1_plen_97_part_00
MMATTQSGAHRRNNGKGLKRKKAGGGVTDEMYDAAFGHLSSVWPSRRHMAFSAASDAVAFARFEVPILVEQVRVGFRWIVVVGFAARQYPLRPQLW